MTTIDTASKVSPSDVDDEVETGKHDAVTNGAEVAEVAADEVEAPADEADAKQAVDEDSADIEAQAEIEETESEDAESEVDAESEDAASDEAADDEAADDDASAAEVADEDAGSDDFDDPVEIVAGEGYWTVNGIALRDISGCLRGTATLDARHGDGQRWASSGVLARLLDEVLAVAVAPQRLSVATMRIEVDFLAPVPLGVPLAISTWVAHRADRRIFCAATLSTANGVVAQGHGSYLVLREAAATSVGA